MVDLVVRMRADLTAAMRARDRATTAVLRATLGAIGNAGVGAADVPRRVLTAADVLAVVRAERDERLAAAAQLETAGSAEAAQELRTGAAVLDGSFPPAG